MTPLMSYFRGCCGDRSPETIQRLGLRCIATLVFLSCLGYPSPSPGAISSDTPHSETGIQYHVVFSDYSALAKTDNLLKRLTSPLTLGAINTALAKSGKTLEANPVDLTKESFVVYVPSHKPDHGYGLMVFVPPWQEAMAPRNWAPVLDQFGLIFVSAERSGNVENVFGRRVPLALLETENVLKRYAVDPERIYIAGMSGGSRVALRIAIDYPDLFRGALLNAGSDAIGVPPNTLPDEAMMANLRASRIVYVTGGRDDAALHAEYESTDSLRKFCIYDFDAEVTPQVGHNVASAEALSRALQSLTKHVVVDSARQAACAAGIRANLIKKDDEAKGLLEANRRDAARRKIIQIDEDFGGMAAPFVVDLARDCSCNLLQ